MNLIDKTVESKAGQAKDKTSHSAMMIAQKKKNRSEHISGTDNVETPTVQTTQH